MTATADGSKRSTSARSIAFQVLLRVQEGAWASEALLAASAGLDSREAGLASELVFGCLRRQLQLDYLITLLPGAGRKLDPEVRIALRLGVYQIRYMDRIPAHAAVSESVDLVKQARKRSAAPFVNAVLRKVHRNPVEWPDRATELSCPAWLLERWETHYGEETAASIARAFLEKPEKYFRAPSGLPEGVEAEPAGIPGSYRLIAGHIDRAQDIGSQSIVPLLDLRSGLSFLDLCAAPGGKTAQALESGVEAFACDLHWQRLRQVNLPGCRRVTLDGTQPLPFRRRFDRILVDAPCSGTGTLGRNPEIKWRIQPEDLTQLQARQKALLRNALPLLEPGGRLVYSTCSLEPEENERVIESLANHWEIHRRIPGVDAGDGFFAAVLGSR